MEGRMPGGPASTPKGLATRDRIVAAAARLSYERGVAGTSLDDIRVAARASGSQLSHYFSGKADLMRAVVAKQTERVVGGQQRMLDAIDGIEGLRAWRDLVVEFQRRADCEAPCPLGTLATELAASEEARADLASSFERWATALRGGLRRMTERGELPASADPDRLAYALLAAFQGGVLMSTTMRRIEPLEAALDTVIDGIAALVEPAPTSTRDYDPDPACVRPPSSSISTREFSR